MPDMEWTIVAKGLWFKYGRDDNYILRGVDIKVEPAKTTIIVGATGSGKTTLLLLLAGLLEPAKGEIYYNNELLRDLLPTIRRHIGVLFQDPNDQLFNSTVYDEIAYSLRTLGIEEYIIREKVERAANILKIDDLLDKRPYTLSMGEKKKVAFASIIVYDPDILFLDEPLANLDYANSKLLENIIMDFKRDKTILVATHNIEFALRVGDLIYGIVNGRVIGPFHPVDFVEKGVKGVGLGEPLVHRICKEAGLDSNSILRLIRDMREYS